MPTMQESVIGHNVYVEGTEAAAESARLNEYIPVTFWPEPDGDVPMWQTSNSRYTDPEGVTWRPIVANGRWVKTWLDKAKGLRGKR